MISSKLLLLPLFAMATGALSQNAPVTKTTSLKTEDRPAAVRVAFERACGSAHPYRTWKVFISTSRQNDRMVANPLWYTYNSKDKGRKIEIRYYPHGKLKSAKCIERINEARQPDQDPPSEKTGEGGK